MVGPLREGKRSSFPTIIGEVGGGGGFFLKINLGGGGGGGGMGPRKAPKAPPPRFGYIPPNDVLYSSTSKYVAGDTSST